MKPLITILLSSIYAQITCANVCEKAGFRDDWPSYCKIEEITIGKNKKIKYTETEELKKLNIVCSFWSSCIDETKAAIEQKVLGNPAASKTTADAITKKNTIDIKVKNYSDTIAEMRKIEELDNTNFQSSFLDTLTSQTDKEKAKKALKLIGDGNLKECLQDTYCAGIYPQLSDFKNNKINEQQAQIDTTKTVKKTLEKEISKNRKDLIEKVKGPFLDDIVKKLNAVDGNNITKDQLSDFCIGMYVNPSANPEAKKICAQVENDKDVLAGIFKDYEKMEKLVNNSANVAELLNLKLKIDKADNSQQAIANVALQEKIQEKLKGTVLGGLMDQMREDMCNVAQNPESMCAGASFGFAKFVDDSGKIVNKEAADSAKEKFQSRAIGATKE